MTGPIVPGALFYAAAAASILLPMLIVWLVMRRKVKRLERESSAALKQLRAESGAALQAEHSRAAALAVEAAKNSAEAAAMLAGVQKRFTTHRQVAERRASVRGKAAARSRNWSFD